MSALAAVMTGRGLGAIATIQLLGESAGALLARLFRGADGKPSELSTGWVLVGHIAENGEIVDQVTVGCEGPNVFAIHCHANPLIVERIMRLLRQSGVQIVAPEQMLAKTFAAQGTGSSIAAEAKQALAVVKTVAGAEILSHQIKSGLSAKVMQWRQELGTKPLSQITAEAEQILRESEPARLIISGCTIALAGPPNTGKSTLLNTLAGRERAVVTDIRGTTRDWVSAEIHIPPLVATIIDTAGLDPGLMAGAIDRAAQRMSIEIIDQSDLVLLILDASQHADQLSESLMDRLLNKRTIVVLNKVDLPRRFDPASVPAHLGQPIHISAKQGTGIEELIQAIHQTLGTTAFDPKAPVAFTTRQTSLLEQLTRAPSSPGLPHAGGGPLRGPPRQK
ncbi:MAG: 50S ribosome-binding GTPase [Sedimentisphaerales bacterium]|nr:50S ribosome-binding GTPase [Sedimentisphaerales bacterium]